MIILMSPFLLKLITLISANIDGCDVTRVTVDMNFNRFVSTDSELLLPSMGASSCARRPPNGQ